MPRSARPKDGIQQKFIGPVMSEIVKLVPDFGSQQEATEFYVKLLKKRRVKTMLGLRFPDPEDQPTGNSLSLDRTNHYYYCWWQADHGPTLSESRQNPMEVLHLFAHIVQPPDSAMHKGEFGKIFLALVEVAYDTDMKRAVKDILLSHKVSTTALSSETRQRQRDAYFKRRTTSLIERFTLEDDEDDGA